jgi:hypothetical protein
MRAEKICKLLSQINSAGLVIGNSKRQNRFRGFKIQKSDDVFAGANINPDKQSRKKIRLLHKKYTTFPAKSWMGRKGITLILNVDRTLAN